MASASSVLPVPARLDEQRSFERNRGVDGRFER